jgi:hypothetical protein
MSDIEMSFSEDSCGRLGFVFGSEIDNYDKDTFFIKDLC